MKTIAKVIHHLAIERLFVGYLDCRIYFSEKVNDDYRDEALANHLKQKQHLFPSSNQFLRSPEEFSGQDNAVEPSIKSHRLQIRDGTLKFRLNDGNLRIGRGFGKRSYGDDPFIDK